MRSPKHLPTTQHRQAEYFELGPTYQLPVRVPVRVPVLLPESWQAGISDTLGAHLGRRHFLLQPLPPWLVRAYSILEGRFLDFIRGAFGGREECAGKVVCGGVEIEVALWPKLARTFLSPSLDFHKLVPMSIARKGRSQSWRENIQQKHISPQRLVPNQRRTDPIIRKLAPLNLAKHMIRAQTPHHAIQLAGLDPRFLGERLSCQ